MLIATNFPSAKLIKKYQRVVDMISIYSKGVCGEKDFKCPRSREDGLPAEKAGTHKVKKGDMFLI
jgi:hypothetical protein